MGAGAEAVPDLTEPVDQLTVVKVPYRDPELEAAEQIDDQDAKTIAVVALFLRSLPPYASAPIEDRKELGREWATAGISLEEIAAWVAVGVASPRRAVELKQFGLSPGDVASPTVDGGPTIGHLYNESKINIETAVSYSRKVAAGRSHQ
jgi:hypothetical protein